jgi:hypothetical protein
MIQDILVEKNAIKSNGMYVDGRNYIINFTGNDQVFSKPGFHMVVTVVKIESRSFSSAEIQHFRTENKQSNN